MSIAKKGMFTVAGVVLGSLIALNVSADADGTIKYRQGIMKAQAGYMGAISMLAQGKAGYGQYLGDHARALHALTNGIPELFPAGSDQGETNALPEIWQNMDDFKRKARSAEEAVAGLVSAAEGGDNGAVLAAFKKVGDGCKACHKDYRKKES